MTESIALYLKDLFIRGRAINTIKNYTLHMQLFSAWCKALNIDYLLLRPKQAKQYRDDIYAQGKSGKTINIMISTLRGFYEFLIESELISGNPIIKNLRVIESIAYPAPLDNEEKHIILSLLDEKSEYVRLAFEVMLSAGLRVSEAANLTKNSVSLRDNRVILNIKNTKGNKSRIIPIMDSLIAKHLYVYTRSFVGEGPLFRVACRTLQGHAANLQKRSGIHFYSHRMRHTYATDLLSQSIRLDVIQRLMDHSSITTTRKYAETMNEDILIIGAKIKGDVL